MGGVPTMGTSPSYIRRELAVALVKPGSWARAPGLAAVAAAVAVVAATGGVCEWQLGSCVVCPLR